MNPLWQLGVKMTGKCYAFTELERATNHNCAVIRATIQDYIRKRASGEVKSDLKGDSDIMSLMLANEKVFNEEDIIDEIIDLMVAGT